MRNKLFSLLSILTFLTSPEHGFSEGVFQSWDRNSSYLLTAPHGGFDLKTDEMVASFCRAVSWNCLTARGFRTRIHPINVNRPTEGVDEVASQELFTPEAQKVYDAYHAKVFQRREESLKLYVEIHGNKRADSRGQIEIATQGISASKAQRIKQLLTDEIKRAELGEIKILIEPLDLIHFTASANKRLGILHDLSPALHLEFPRALREELKLQTIAFLSSALPRLVEAEFP
jgi:hypothetical protein